MHSELEHVENCTPEDGLVFLPFPKGIKKHTETGPEKATSPGNDFKYLSLFYSFCGVTLYACKAISQRLIHS